MILLFLHIFCMSKKHFDCQLASLHGLYAKPGLVWPEEILHFSFLASLSLAIPIPLGP